MFSPPSLFYNYIFSLYFSWCLIFVCLCFVTEFLLILVWTFFVFYLFFLCVHAAFSAFFSILSFFSVLSCVLVCSMPVVPLFLLSRWRAVWSCRTPWHFGSGTMRPLRLSNHLKNPPLHPAWYVEELPVLWTTFHSPHPPPSLSWSLLTLLASVPTFP